MSEVRYPNSIPYFGVTWDGRVMNALSGKWLSVCDNGRGYKQVFVCVQGKHYMRYVHRLVAECYIPNPDGLPEVNHKDGNKANNVVGNLEWCTRSQNLAHAIKTGLKPPTSEKQRKAASITGKRTIAKVREGWSRWAQTEEAQRVWLNNIEAYNQQRHEEALKRPNDERIAIRRAKDKRYYARHRGEILRKKREKREEHEKGFTDCPSARAGDHRHGTRSRESRDEQAQLLEDNESLL